MCREYKSGHAMDAVVKEYLHFLRGIDFEYIAEVQNYLIDS